MNVNLSPSTESTKMTQGVVDGNHTVTEASEDEGFFAKLAAFIKGEPSAETVKGDANVDSSTLLEVGTTSEVGRDLDDVAVTKGDDKPIETSDASSDETLLNTKENSVETELQSNDVDSEKSVTIPEKLENFIEKPASNEGSGIKAEQAISENEQFLGRLNQSVQALQEKDGNSLPPQGAPESVSNEHSVQLVETKSVKSLENASNTPQISTINGEAIDVSELDELQAAQSTQTQMGQAPLEQLDSAQNPPSETNESSEVHTIAWSGQAAVAATEASKLGKDEGVLKSNPQLVQTLQHTQSQLQQSAQTQAALQAGNSSSAANSAVLAMNTPMDLAAAQQIQTMTGPVNSAVQSEQLMQAALGLKGASALGKLASQGDGQAPVGIEASLAQQLGQTVGTQGLNAQLRPEQAAQQPAMPLNRELVAEQVAERVQVMLSKNLKNIDIRLDPPELGRMQIRMNMNGDSTSVHFTVANGQARDIVEQAMPRLREMLAQQGLQLADTSVQQQSAGQQQGRYATSNEGGSGQGSSDQHGSSEENLEPDVKLDLNVATKRDGISYYA